MPTSPTFRVQVQWAPGSGWRDTGDEGADPELAVESARYFQNHMSKPVHAVRVVDFLDRQIWPDPA
jgi:hypothetical protein